MSVDIDRKAAAALGVDEEDVTRTIEFYSGPLPVTTFVSFGRLWPVVVQVKPGAGDDWTKNLDKLKVRSREGHMVPLATLVKVRPVEAPAVLDFFNLHPMVEITANLEPGMSVEQGRQLCTRLAEGIRKELGLSGEYRLSWLR
jgi:multidrug efflux pump subunit AcrB